MGGLARRIPLTFVDLRDRHRGDRRHPAARRLLLEGRDPLVRASPASRGGSPLLWRVAAAHGAADRVLHVPPALAHVLRPLAHGRREVEHHVHESPLVDDRRAGRAGGAVGGRRLHRGAALPRAAAAAARRSHEHLQHFETPLLVVSVALALAGLARRGVPVRRRRPSAPSGCARASPALHRVLSGKYFVDELYDALHRQAAALDLRPRLPAPRRPRAPRRHAARPGRARRGARPACSARVQTGSLHLYAWFVLRRHRRRAALELAPCLTPALLNLVLFLPLLGIGAARRRCPRERPVCVRRLSLCGDDRAVRARRRWLYARFDAAVAGLQFETRLPWIAAWGVYYQIGLDGFNVLLVLLTAFLGPLVVAGAFTAITKDVKLFYAMVFLIQFAMLGTFLAQDLFLFYLFWEAMLIPMFLHHRHLGRRAAHLRDAQVRALHRVRQHPDARGGDLPRLVAAARRPASRRSPSPTSYQRAAAARRADDPARRVRALVRDQGADRAAAHLAARRARRGADRGLGDPRRRAAEDGHVRLHEARLPALSRRDAARSRRCS